MLLQRNDPVHRRVRKGDRLIRPAARLLIELRIDVRLQLGTAADGVFAGDDVQLRLRVALLAQLKARGNRAGNMLQYRYADRRRHQIRFRNRPRGFLRFAYAVQRGDARNRQRFAMFAGKDDGILPAPFQFGNDAVVYVNEANLVARTGQQQPDESSSDVARAKMDRLHHYIPLRGYRQFLLRSRRS